jgi:hypothetical protein
MLEGPIETIPAHGPAEQIAPADSSQTKPGPPPDTSDAPPVDPAGPATPPQTIPPEAPDESSPNLPQELPSVPNNGDPSSSSSGSLDALFAEPSEAELQGVRRLLQLASASEADDSPRTQRRRWHKATPAVGRRPTALGALRTMFGQQRQDESE